MQDNARRRAVPCVVLRKLRCVASYCVALCCVRVNAALRFVY